ncbi:MAG: QueT transporter family protein [Clostridiaceae bacterium]|nr:QueT transporter family protein [Clostridiaceae bacterium]
MKRSVQFLTRSAVIAAAYLVLTLPLAQIAFGPIQFRLAEALTVLAAITPSAIPGLFVGCLISNLMNPQNLGPVDIVFGSLATLLAAWLTWQMNVKLLGRQDQSQPGGGKTGRIRQTSIWFRHLVVLSPAVWVNAIVVGFYLPWIIPDLTVTAGFRIWTIASIFLSQSVVIYLIGLPVYLALKKMRLFVAEDV